MKVAAFTRPFPGETANGDGYLLAVLEADGSIGQLVSSPRLPSDESQETCLDIGDEETLLVAVVDGIGHGPVAAEATRVIIECIERHLTEDLGSLVKACHQDARSSRGATVALARVRPVPRKLELLAVGDVRAWLMEPRCETKEFVSVRGLVGYQIESRLLIQSAELPRGGYIALASDGLVGDLAPGDSLPTGSPVDLAQRLVKDSATDRDDVTIVVCGES
jgi:serine/threonine protein phosphatase PrpC